MVAIRYQPVEHRVIPRCECQDTVYIKDIPELSPVSTPLVIVWLANDKNTKLLSSGMLGIMEGTKRKNNPYKVNQYTGPDPRQAGFLTNYLDPKSETFSNALQSALKAGYTQGYGESLMAQMPTWLSEKLGDLDMLNRAEKNISDVLDLDPKVQAMGAFGPLFETKGKKKTPIMITNPKLLQIKTDTSKFVAERLGRVKYGQQKANVIVPVQVNFGDDREKYA